MDSSSSNNVRAISLTLFLDPDQSDLAWADNDNFPPFTNPNPPFTNINLPGYVIKFYLSICFIHNDCHLDSLDPLIGQGTRSMIGLDPLNPLNSLSMGVFIIPKGGEYFFSPSINGLKNTIAKA